MFRRMQFLVCCVVLSVVGPAAPMARTTAGIDGELRSNVAFEKTAARSCPRGYYREIDGRCYRHQRAKCPPGHRRDRQGQCYWPYE